MEVRHLLVSDPSSKVTYSQMFAYPISGLGFTRSHFNNEEKHRRKYNFTERNWLHLTNAITHIISWLLQFIIVINSYLHFFLNGFYYISSGYMYAFLTTFILGKLNLFWVSCTYVYILSSVKTKSLIGLSESCTGERHFKCLSYLITKLS